MIKVPNPDVFSKALQTTLRVYSKKRHNFLTGMITHLIATTLLMSAIFFPLSCSTPPETKSKAKLALPSRVDVHCHIFNARDLPVKGAIKKYLNDILKDMIKLQNPSFSDFVIQLIAHPATDALTNDTLSDTPNFDTEDGELDGLLSAGLTPTCVGFAPSGTPFLGLFEDWITLLKQPRHQIACKLIETYQGIDLFTPAFLDTGDWLADKAETTVKEQIDLYEKIILLFKGKIHPLVAFDPKSQVDYSGPPENAPFELVKQAVEERGFIGVKVYPPMGFYPINNTGNMISSDKFYSDREKIDEALESLYDWCIEKDVPIMAHCGKSNGSQPGYEERTNPIYWKELLDFQDPPGNYKYRTLRLNLGHFGGADSVIAQTGWAWAIAELMDNPAYPHVYADTGYHDVVLEGILPNPNKHLYIEGLAALYTTYPEVKEYLMYGSDWHMITVLEGHKEYLTKFDEIFDANFLNVKSDFFMENALRFFGLDGTDSQNRQRLQMFYEKHNMTKKPKWWVGGWWLDTAAPAPPTGIIP